MVRGNLETCISELVMGNESPASRATGCELASRAAW
jgi:hypothetical protein